MLKCLHIHKITSVTSNSNKLRWNGPLCRFWTPPHRFISVTLARARNNNGVYPAEHQKEKRKRKKKTKLRNLESGLYLKLMHLMNMLHANCGLLCINLVFVLFCVTDGIKLLSGKKKKRKKKNSREAWTENISKCSRLSCTTGSCKPFSRESSAKKKKSKHTYVTRLCPQTQSSFCFSSSQTDAGFAFGVIWQPSNRSDW